MNTTKLHARTVGPGLAFLLAAGGCAEHGHLSLLLTDAQDGDVTAAIVTLQEIYLQGEGGRISLRQAPITTDLVTLANDTATLVDDATIPQGTYHDLRFVLDGAAIQVLEEGAEHLYATPGYEGVPPGREPDGNLVAPSFGESGLKVTLPEGGIAVEGDQKVVLADFDVTESFGHEAGEADAWVMHPVVRAADLELTAEIVVLIGGQMGIDMSPLVGAEARLYDAAGNLEAIAPLERAAGQVFRATFLYLIPSEGPFRLEVAPGPGVTFQSDPALPLVIDMASGGIERVSLMVEAMQVVP